MSDPVLSDLDGGVLTLTFNRSERMNTWARDLADSFYGLVDDADRDEQVRAIVVTGSPRAFCAGADLGGQALDDEDVVGAGDGVLAAVLGPRQPYSLLAVRKPLIAAINGACAGVGLTLALMCDVRFAASDSRFSTAFARRGLVAEQGMSWILPRVVGRPTALDLLMSARRFGADEAERIGLVSSVTAPEKTLAAAREYAADLAGNCSPWAMAQIKRQVHDDAYATAAVSTERSVALMEQALTRPDLIEGIGSFFEKRPPVFPPLPAESDHPVSAGVNE